MSKYNSSDMKAIENSVVFWKFRFYLVDAIRNYFDILVMFEPHLEIIGKIDHETLYAGHFGVTGC